MPSRLCCYSFYFENYSNYSHSVECIRAMRLLCSKLALVRNVEKQIPYIGCARFHLFICCSLLLKAIREFDMIFLLLLMKSLESISNCRGRTSSQFTWVEAGENYSSGRMQSVRCKTSDGILRSCDNHNIANARGKKRICILTLWRKNSVYPLWSLWRRTKVTSESNVLDAVSFSLRFTLLLLCLLNLLLLI